MNIQQENYMMSHFRLKSKTMENLVSKCDDLGQFYIFVGLLVAEKC